MRLPFRTPPVVTALGPQLSRDLALVCVADAVVGASFGAIAFGTGLPAWLPVVLSVLVFAGASQFILVGILAAGGGMAAAVAAGLLVNLRHLPFGFAVADLLRGSIGRRLVGSHLMVDESVAFSLAVPDPARRRLVYWTCGLGLFACWNASVFFGVLAGRVVGDTDAWGLDAAFPAVLLALVLPALRDAVTRRAALIGATIALLASFFLPAGLPVLLALLGLVAVIPRFRGAARDPGDPGSPEAAA
jgi:4-azaleucine resistance transporter AzlC